ncbi:hypothetical protein GCM10022409_19180 [Hymenobacter glaciei]|uniref:PLD phosphodiesterase domain-containing protein n=1 Tax=Hymenobacter glaciei TaxID=877209 RepID=A0ABP7U2N4_9BACT
MLDKLSGTYYVAEHSAIIKQLNAVHKHALVGIQRADGIYTIIGSENIYYSTSFGVEGEISIKDFLNILRENALRLGKTAKYEFIAINDRDVVWVMNPQVMSALWNTLLLLAGSSR